MKIAQETIDWIKTNHDLAAYIRPYVKKLQKTGKVYVALCPFHPDTKRSLVIDPAKRLWNCLGACSAKGKGSGGDIISFAQKYHGWSFPEAVTHLGPPQQIEVSNDTRRKVPAILSQVIDTYYRSFLESRSAQEYIASRGLDPQLLKQYKAGYVDGSLLERVSRDSENWKLLKEIKIITENDLEHFRTCVVFPLTAFNSFPQGLYGRAIGSDLHLYLPGPRRGLFNWQYAKNYEELILTESVIDALSFIQCGYLNVIPIYGVNGFIQEHIDFVVRFRTKKVVLALDNDSAGKTAAANIAEKFAKMHVPARIIELPRQDANELLTKEGVEAFKQITGELLKKETSPSITVSAQIQPEAIIPAFEMKEGELSLSIEDRSYMIRGVPKKAYSKLRVSIKITTGESYYLDSADLLSARNRTTFAARASAHFDLPRPILEKDLIAVLDAIEQYQKQPEEETKPKRVEPSGAEKEEALRFLSSPHLLDEIAADMEALGYVGEEANKKLGYLGSISRFLDEPFSIVILSQSGSGKSYMADVLEKLTAPEDVKMYSRLTPASLYYMGKEALSHKFVIIEERSGSADSDYSIRTLQSKQRLTLAAPIKNPETGKIATVEFEVLGPTAFLETTTASRINYENSTRCFEMYLDETVEQTQRIHHRQRLMKTIQGRKLQDQQKEICAKHHNAQRLLKPVRVVIPFAPEIEFPASWLRTRRDHQRFLNLIEVIAFLHQYHKEIRAQGDKHYIEADLRDYEIACKLAADILPETLSDIKKPLSKLLSAIEEYAEKQEKAQRVDKHEVVFSRREIREETGLPNYRIKELFRELEELEYLEVEKSTRGFSYQYRLVSGKANGQSAGLLSVEELKRKWVEVEGNGHFQSKAAARALFSQGGRVEVQRA